MVERPVDALVIFTGTIGLVTSSSAITVLIAEVAASHASATTGASVDGVMDEGGSVDMLAAAAAASASGSGFLKLTPSVFPPVLPFLS